MLPATRNSPQRKEASYQFVKREYVDKENITQGRCILIYVLHLADEISPVDIVF